MSQPQPKIIKAIIVKNLHYLPGLALGLFIGRVASEILARFIYGTNILIAVIITAFCITLSLWMLRKQQIRDTWPLLILLIYVVSPESSIRLFLSTAAVVTIIIFLDSKLFPVVSLPKHLPILGQLVLFFGFFLLFLVTLAPDLLPADNGEFQLIATNLGVAHPPGFSLYTIIAHLLTRLPVGPSPAYRVNLLSAITSTLTLVVTYITIYKLTKQHLAGVISVIALGSATTFWAQATTANIRSLTVLFASLMILFLVFFYESEKDDNENGKRSQRADRFIILFAFIFGLGLTHHPSLLFIGIVSVLFIVAVDPSIIKSPKRWWKPILVFIVGFIPWIYFPLRAYSDARGASPELASFPGFLEHVLAIGFRGDFFTYLEIPVLWERIKIIGNILTFQFNPWLLVIMIISLIVLIFARWRLALLLGGSFILFTFITATYRAPQTVEYMLPAYIPMVLLLGVFFGDLVKNNIWLTRTESGHIVGSLLLSISILAVIYQVIGNYPSYRQLHSDTSSRDYAQPLLLDAPPNATILADWHWVTPLWYLQEVEGLREDVSVRFVFPEGGSYAETWVSRIEDELANSNPVISTHFDPLFWETLPISEPIHEAFLFSQAPRLALPDQFQSLDVTLGGQIDLLGYSLANKSVEIGSSASLTLAWQPTSDVDLSNTTLFAHLVGSDGLLYGQQDLAAKSRSEGITLTQFQITPRPGAAPDKYQIYVGAYQEVSLQSELGEERTYMTDLDVLHMSSPLVTKNNLDRIIIGQEDSNLIGYDWDNSLPDKKRLYLHWQKDAGYQTEIRDQSNSELPNYLGPWGLPSNNWSSVLTATPGNYVPLGQGIVWIGEQLESGEQFSPGDDLILSQRFLSSRPVMRDNTVSVRLIGYEDDGYHWEWWDLHDSIPAMGAIPTLKWINGSNIRSPHFVEVEPSAWTGQELGGALILYDAFTGRPLPILDERISNEFSWIPLGVATVGE